jgi:hypothetical protein
MSALGRTLLLAAGLALLSAEAWAQARPVVPPPSPTAKERVEVRKPENLGTAARLRTPDYTVSSANDPNPVLRDWARVVVNFKTYSDWIDELEFRYYVQVQNSTTKAMRRFLGTFYYVDIPKGQNHLASVFLNPNAVQRYGDIVGIAVEVYCKGGLVAFAANPEGDLRAPWWRSATGPGGTTIKDVAGVLLERAQTPFAFVAYDAYVTAKPK